MQFNSGLQLLSYADRPASPDYNIRRKRTKYSGLRDDCVFCHKFEQAQWSGVDIHTCRYHFDMLNAMITQFQTQQSNKYGTCCQCKQALIRPSDGSGKCDTCLHTVYCIIAHCQDYATRRSTYNDGYPLCNLHEHAYEETLRIRHTDNTNFHNMLLHEGDVQSIANGIMRKCIRRIVLRIMARYPTLPREIKRRIYDMIMDGI